MRSLGSESATRMFSRNGGTPPLDHWRNMLKKADADISAGIGAVLDILSFFQIHMSLRSSLMALAHRLLLSNSCTNRV